MATWIRKGIFRLGPDIVALILFTVVWFGLVVSYGGKIHLVEGSTVLPSFIALFILSTAFFSHIREIIQKKGPERTSFYRRARRMARDWLPLIYLVAVYETLRDYTGIIRPDSIDPTLYKLDVAVFGAEPTVWIQQFIHPFWTDYFAFMYMLYFLLPMIVATLLYIDGKRLHFRELALGCVLCMYGGFLLYLIFPAGPPRFFEGIDWSTWKLTGLFGFYEFTQGKMDSSTHVMHHSSFPSLHVALSTLAICHAFRFSRLLKMRWLIVLNTWIAVSIWIATVYLRHHWAMDIFAGWLLGTSSFLGQMWIQKKWYGSHHIYADLPADDREVMKSAVG